MESSGVQGYANPNTIEFQFRLKQNTMTRRFQFSLKTMLSSVGMICIGVAMIAILHRESLVPGAVILPVVFFPTWLGGGALIGAGLSRPFGNWWIGMVVVWVVQIVATELVFGPNF